MFHTDTTPGLWIFLFSPWYRSEDGDKQGRGWSTAEIISFPNQDYFWAFFGVLVVVCFLLFFFFGFCFFSILSPGAKRLRIHYPGLQNALHLHPLLGPLFSLLESDYQLPNNAVIKPQIFSFSKFYLLTKKKGSCFNHFNILEELLTWKEWKGLEYSGRRQTLTCLSLWQIPSLWRKNLYVPFWKKNKSTAKVSDHKHW